MAALSIRHATRTLPPQKCRSRCVVSYCRGAGRSNDGVEINRTGRREAGPRNPAEEGQVSHRAGQGVRAAPAARRSAVAIAPSCARTESWTVRDLGSRNGTYVNDQRITEEVPLSVGDELRVGPLKFRVGASVSAAAKSEPTPPPRGRRRQAAQAAARQGRGRRRAAHDQQSRSSATEDDVSRWLLGIGRYRASEADAQGDSHDPTGRNNRSIASVPPDERARGRQTRSADEAAEAT